MKSVTCPNCRAVLPPQEIADGWCESCGKRLPPFVLSGATHDTRPIAQVAAHHHAVTTEPAKSSFGGYMTVFGCVVLGALVTLALESGKTNWLWLGCGIGAGVLCCTPADEAARGRS